MIKLKNISLIIAEDKYLPIEKGGELEQYVGKPLQQILLENFGLKAELEITKE